MTRPRISLLPLRTPHTWCSLLLSLVLLCACGQHKREPGTNGAFAKAPQTEGATLARISEGGELIIATLSGPDTYFDYQGKAMGLQYALAEDFAATLGVGIRVEVATDTLHLLRLLQRAALLRRNGDIPHKCQRPCAYREKTMNENDNILKYGCNCKYYYG